MSGKPQHGFGVSEEDVSRETSEATQEQVMLNKILDRATPHIPDPPEEEPGSESGIGAPIGIQRSGSNEERRGSGADEPSLSRRVSRETPGENPPDPEKAVPPPPEKNKRSSVYVYLAVMFGAAFLMLLLAYFVQQRNNATVLDDLRMTNASREELLENITALEEERDQLQKEVTYQKDRVAQKNEETSRAQESLENMIRSLSDRSIQKHSLEYFWYLDHFMENKEYTLASAVILFSADYYRSTWNSQVSVNPAQVGQYEAYRQELIDRGYLQPLSQARDGGTDLWFADKWDPSQSEDTAALCILWCALNQHFVIGNDNGASQYLYLQAPNFPDYSDRIARLASGFTLEQFQVMKDQLAEDGWIVVAEDGTMEEGPGPHDVMKDDILYSLPFELPLSITSNIPIS